MKKNPHSPNEIGDYILGIIKHNLGTKKLGEGTFSKVKLGTHKITNENVAIKILEKSKINDVADTERVLREIHILKLMRHPNIVQLYDIVETPKTLLLVMQFMENGELFNYIVKNQRIHEEEACRLFHQLIDAIQHIHKIGITHRDLKPQNLLLDHRNNLKLVDFGLSNTYKKNEKLKTPCGSQCYAAPEMLRGEAYEGIKVDIWSAGVILFAMLCGYLPFEQMDNFNALYEKIVNSDYKMYESVSKSARDLIKSILTVDTQQRYTIDQIKKHPWMTKTMKSNSGYDIANTISRGIVIGYNPIPVDKTVLSLLSQYGFSETQIEKTLSSLEANRHNSLTTTYYLIFKKYLKNGNKSDYDLGSDSFDPKILSPSFSNPKKSSTRNQMNGFSIASKRSARETGKISVLLDNYMTKEKNETEGRQKSRSRSKIKDKSKQRERKKSKDKFFQEKSITHIRQPSQNKNKIFSKENIPPNVSTEVQPKPRRQRVNSRPSKIDPAIENSINYGRGSIAGNSSNIINSKSIDKNIHRHSCSKDKERQSHFENRLNRKYKEKFNQSLVSRSRDHHRPPLSSKQNNASVSSHMIGSHNHSSFNINSTRLHVKNTTNRPEKQIGDQLQNRQDIKQVIQKEIKGRNRRVLSHKNKKSNGCINPIKSDLNRIPKAKWV